MFTGSGSILVIFLSLLFVLVIMPHSTELAHKIEIIVFITSSHNGTHTDIDIDEWISIDTLKTIFMGLKLLNTEVWVIIAQLNTIRR